MRAVAALAMKRGKSVDFTGDWQRHITDRDPAGSAAEVCGNTGWEVLILPTLCCTRDTAIQANRTVWLVGTTKMVQLVRA